MGKATHKVLMGVTRYLKGRLIPDDPNNRYLERYHVCTLFGYTVFLHRFVTPVDDRHYHTHPWHFAFSLILSGGYFEHRLERDPVEGEDYSKLRVFEKHFGAGSVNILRRGDSHRIADGRPNTWTLFVCSHDVTEWGFWDADRAGKAEFTPAVTAPRLPAWWVPKAVRGRHLDRAP